MLAGGLAAGLGVGGWAYASEDGIPGSQDAAYVTSQSTAQSPAAAAIGGAATLQAGQRDQNAAASRSQERAAIPATPLDVAALTTTSRQATTAATQRMATAKKAADALAAKQAKAKKEAQAAAAKKAAIDNAKANPKAAARVLMNKYDWASDRQFGCLVKLWTGESDWRWWAKNPSSGAYGIPQSLPASKMAKFGSDYRTNPITQLTWGLWYIDVSYGTPCNALSFWQNNMPHWY